MRRSLRLIAILATITVLGSGGRRVLAQQAVTTMPLTVGQQVLVRYVLPSNQIPSGLKQADITSLDNVIVAATAEDPAAVQNIINRGRIDGLEQDFNRTDTSGIQVALQFSLFKDAGGALADVGDPSPLAGLTLTPATAPALGDASAAYTSLDANLATANIVFSSDRMDVLITELGQPDQVKVADLLDLARVVASRTRLAPPPVTPDELAVLQAQVKPESILHDAFALLLQNYLHVLSPDQLLNAAYSGAIKSLVTAGVGNLPAPPSITSTDDDTAWGQFLPAYQQLESLLPSSLTAADLAYAAGTEMYNNLNCHTTFFTPTFYSRYIAEAKGEQEARIGILIQQFPTAPYTILRVEQGSPAEQAGLKPADQIVAVDHQTPTQAGEHFSELFIGPAGSPITLTIKRQGMPDTFDVTIVRQQLKPVIEQHKILPGGIGYIDLEDFTDGNPAVDAVSKALQDFQAAGNVNNWIIDLRYNSGGSEATLERIAGLFVPDGSLLATETMQDGTVMTAKSIGTPPPGQKPMVILMDQGTASAAEVFTQSMKDLGRATLVGDTTAGCVNGGLPFSLLDGSGVFVSDIDLRVGPNKVAVENVGIKPDLSVQLSLADVQSGTDPQLAAAEALFTGAPLPTSQPSQPTSTSRPPVILERSAGLWRRAASAPALRAPLGILARQ